LSPTEKQKRFAESRKLPVGDDVMRQKTNKLATLCSVCIVPGALLYGIGDNLVSPNYDRVPVEQHSYDIPTASPIQFIDLTRAFDDQITRVNSAAAVDAPIDISPRSDTGIDQPARAATPLPLITASIEDSPAIKVSPETAPAVEASPAVDASPAVAAPPRQAAIEMPSPAQARSFVSPPKLAVGVDRLSFDTPALAPMAFMRFCLRYADDCKITKPAFRPSPVALTPARRAELVAVNREVNRAIEPQANVNGVMAEEWLVSPRQGDCNDYAVTKRHELLARGWPSRALLLTEVMVSSGEHHLVLVVRTREQDLVLDNLNWNVRPISQIQYELVRAQQANNPKFWSTASVSRSARVAMNTR
jgi:predicted transglutaminase-like cysteine proteinase